MDGVRAPRLLRIPAASTTNTPPTDYPRFIARNDLIDAVGCLLWREFEGSPEFGPEDGNYYSLTAAQISDLLAFERARKEPFPYIADAWDCDDMAREFHHNARIWSVRLTGGAPLAPAVGLAYVRLDGEYPLFPGNQDIRGVYHVINVILRNDGQWFFFEPQTGMVIPIEAPIYEGVIEVLKIQI